MKLVPINFGHILQVVTNLRSDDYEQFANMYGAHDVDRMINMAFNASGPKWAYVTDQGEALVVGGFIPGRPGVGVFSTWFFASKAAWVDYPREISEMAAERIKNILETSAHRVETICLASREKARKWYETIGLTYESTLTAYCADGSDAVLYRALKVPDVSTK
jgi:hypothetical protein